MRGIGVYKKQGMQSRSDDSSMPCGLPHGWLLQNPRFLRDAVPPRRHRIAKKTLVKRRKPVSELTGIVLSSRRDLRRHHRLRGTLGSKAGRGIGNRDRAAFTLLELMVTLIVIGLIGGVTAMATAPQLRLARLTAIVDRIENADRNERDAARRSPFPGAVQINFAKRSLRYSQSSRPIELPKGWKFGEVRSASAGRLRSGDETISRFSSDGQSSSYAIQVQHEASGTRSWVLFLGLSGQSLRSNDEAFIDAVFANARRR